MVTYNNFVNFLDTVALNSMNFDIMVVLVIMVHELQTLYTIRTFNFGVLWDISTRRRFCYDLFGERPSDLRIGDYSSKGVKFQNNWSNIHYESIVYYLSLF